MLLSNIENSKGKFKVFLLQTPASKLEMFLYDKIKTDLHCTQDTIFEVKDKKTVREIREIAFIDSFMSDKWLVRVNLDKASSYMTDLLQVIYESTTIVFFCTCSNYKVFKNFTTSLKKKGVTEVYSYYLASLKRMDFDYLYKQFVQKNNKLSQTLYNHVYQGYSYSVDAVMDLFTELKNGVVFENRRDIADVCGVGGNSIESFIFSMLKKPSESLNGLKTVIKNRMKAGVELSEIYGVSRFQNYLKASVVKMVQLKELEISGLIYKKVFDLPNGFDEAKLVKYQRFLWRLKEIPMTRLLRLYKYMSESNWVSDFDFAGFVYKYMLDIMRYEVVPYMTVTTAEDEYIKAQRLEAERQKEAEREQERLESRTRLEYIKQYGVLQGRERFESDKAAGKLRMASNVIKADHPTDSLAKGTKPRKRKASGIVETTTNSTPEEQAKDAAASFREMLAALGQA
jgi:hypothetical protein